MKRLITIFLILALVVPAATLADIDVSSMSDQELKDMIAACSSELTARASLEPDGILLFNAGGMRMYQTGDAYINKTGLLCIPVVVCNDLNERAAINLKDETCNGWDIMSQGGAETKAKSKKKAEMFFWVNKADVTDISQITSLRFRWTVFSMETAKTLYEEDKIGEHRFW